MKLNNKKCCCGFNLCNNMRRNSHFGNNFITFIYNDESGKGKLYTAALKIQILSINFNKLLYIWVGHFRDNDLNVRKLVGKSNEPLKYHVSLKEFRSDFSIPLPDASPNYMTNSKYRVENPIILTDHPINSNSPNSKGFEINFNLYIISKIIKKQIKQILRK